MVTEAISSTTANQVTTSGGAKAVSGSMASNEENRALLSHDDGDDRDGVQG